MWLGLFCSLIRTVLVYGGPTRPLCGSGPTAKGNPVPIRECKRAGLGYKNCTPRILPFFPLVYHRAVHRVRVSLYVCHPDGCREHG